MNVPSLEEDTYLEEDYNSLWEIANLAFEELKVEEKQNLESNKNKFTNKCEHKFVCEDVCTECGACLNNTFISYQPEWNNYKDDCGNYVKNTQRCDNFNDSNPYSKGGGTFLSANKNSLIAKLHIQQTFSHKQKTYWLISKEIEHAASYLNINSKITIDTATKYWYKYMESGKLTRASVRKGLIAACLFYSCNINNIPIERQEILKAFSCDTKTLSKGEKVLFEILNTNNLTYINVQSKDSNSFIRYCSLLKLEHRISYICNDLYNKYKVQLQAVSPKSAVGGIIAYVVKYELLLKLPTKTVISATVDVCTPTLNKVIQIIYNFEKKK
jgi:transcription initiation factor TFIIIB Brf1 subunit/transcription initiation factor TFIIB